MAAFEVDTLPFALEEIKLVVAAQLGVQRRQATFFWGDGSGEVPVRGIEKEPAERGSLLELSVLVAHEVVVPFVADAIPGIRLDEHAGKITANIQTRFSHGVVFSKAFPFGLWRDGQAQGQGKMLFLRDGRVCFDVGWVGCVTSSCRVDDGQQHEVGIAFDSSRVALLVDGVEDAEWRLELPADHPETEFTIGRSVGHAFYGDGVINGDMAPDFRGEIWSLCVNGARVHAPILRSVAASDPFSRGPGFERPPDLGGQNGGFRLTARIRTVHGRGTICAMAFASGLWRPGAEGQAKALFVQEGLVCFDIGWVGALVGSTRVDDGEEHTVGVEYDAAVACYHLLVDDRQEVSGLRAVADDFGTEFSVGRAVGHSLFGNIADGSMAPDFRGAISDLRFG